MGKEIVYIAELDQDVDDVIAAEYLLNKGVLKCVVLDPLPKTQQGYERKQELIKLGIDVKTKFPLIAKYVIVGGALTSVAQYILDHKIEYLIMNGGFVGNNIVKTPLKKFLNKTEVRTFNFNLDIDATHKVLTSNNINHIMLVGKNVCHDKRNSLNGIWENEENLIRKYQANDTKLQHDLLACREGLIELGLLKESSFLEYKQVKPYNKGLNGNKTLWGSKNLNESSLYRVVKAAINWK